MENEQENEQVLKLNTKRVAAVIIVAIVILTIILVILAIATKVTKSNYDQIEMGMYMCDVVDILGSNYSVQSTSEVASHTSDILVWTNNYKNKSIVITFVDGKVISKAQSGL